MPFGDQYFQQASLLVRMLPYVAQETCFALKGGTAINLFIRNMPRLSVDIDLTYLPLNSRQIALAEIDVALARTACAPELRALQVTRDEAFSGLITKAVSAAPTVAYRRRSRSAWSYAAACSIPKCARVAHAVEDKLEALLKCESFRLLTFTRESWLRRWIANIHATSLTCATCLLTKASTTRFASVSSPTCSATTDRCGRFLRASKEYAR